MSNLAVQPVRIVDPPVQPARIYYELTVSHVVESVSSPGGLTEFGGDVFSGDSSWAKALMIAIALHDMHQPILSWVMPVFTDRQSFRALALVAAVHTTCVDQRFLGLGMIHDGPNVWQTNHGQER